MEGELGEVDVVDDLNLEGFVTNRLLVDEAIIPGLDLAFLQAQGLVTEPGNFFIVHGPCLRAKRLLQVELDPPGGGTLFDGVGRSREIGGIFSNILDIFF